ncbi:hypothetical protein SAMN05428988_6252 [Chitinophaga sp. YR573]|uniref:InlB B-repeat-containing protein n=1 Tax=Chitinophaga sp. YR573 TaxID=1881040 RepID=UPI0008B08B61|nr:hypothetical protein [Chitinophaga sp. YR573]SEW46109.1 hypothetical protein SAMN05428988_6252 [Chitinophaga sp. YR573]
MRSLLFGGLLCLTLFSACQKSSTPAPDNNNTITDSATVTVVNGYGSGKYKIGDTVNIWSTAIPDNAVFDSWTGFTNLLQNSGEWHNSFVMPAQNVTVTATTKTSVAYTLQYEKIKGVNILKNVYYYFPSSPKGIAFLLHGTGGSAQNIANNYDWILMIRDLVNAGFAVVVTEAEEVSLGTDTNGDGNLRWQTLPLDSTTSIDYANIKAIRDTFYARGYANPTIPLYSIGMSNGGAFSCSLSYLYKFKSGIAYCAQGFQVVFNTSVIPFQFCMAKYDDNDQVGTQGDADALTYSQLLTGRGVCSKYFLQDKSPAYPERFARRSDISITTSTAFFNELKTNHWMDAKNYMTITADSLAPILLANPTTYPTYKSLNVSQRLFVTDQIDEMYAAHHFFSDLNKTTIKFLTSQCQ